MVMHAESLSRFPLLFFFTFTALALSAMTPVSMFLKDWIPLLEIREERGRVFCIFFISGHS